MIESGETEQLEKVMLHRSSASCSPSDSKGNDGSSLGFRPLLGPFYICGTVAALALLYILICLLMKNVETLMTHIQGTSENMEMVKYMFGTDLFKSPTWEESMS